MRCSCIFVALAVIRSFKKIHASSETKSCPDVQFEEFVIEKTIPGTLFIALDEFLFPAASRSRCPTATCPRVTHNIGHGPKFLRKIGPNLTFSANWAEMKIFRILQLFRLFLLISMGSRDKCKYQMEM